MKTTFMIAAVLAGGATAAYAQDPPAAQPPAQTVPAPAAAPAKPAISVAERQLEVRLMENIFANSVRVGAEELGRRMMAVDPGSVISTGTARARGITLEGYGVLFDVDVPLMNMSVIWTRRQMVVQEYLDRIHGFQEDIAHATSADEQQRAKDRLSLLNAQLQLMLPPGDPRTALGNSAVMPIANAAPPAPGTAVAATVDALPPVPLLETRDTNVLYTDAVKKALMDAMVNHSLALKLGDDEWLIVAARDNGGPSIQGAIADRSGIILRVKGSDLAAFKADKLSRDEILKKVEILEWR
jgi:hypothetical protein